MAKQNPNIHDAYVKETFSDKERAVAFFEAFLPPDVARLLNFDTLNVTKESYIDNALKEHFSDLVFEVDTISINEGDRGEVINISLIFEHKSNPDNHILFQIGHYLFAHWNNQLKSRDGLKPIIPVIYYQGKRKWTIPTIQQTFKHLPIEIRKYLPDIPNILIPLRNISENEINALRNSLLSAALMAQQVLIDPVKLGQDIGKILRLFPVSDQSWNFLEMTLVYIQKQVDIKPEEIILASEEIPQELKSIVMTTYDQIMQKGEQIGMQKGEQIGILEEKTRVVLKSYDNNVDMHTICVITSLSIDEVKTILKAHDRM